MRGTVFIVELTKKEKEGKLGYSEKGEWGGGGGGGEMEGSVLML